MFTDEADAVSAVEIVPVSIVDEASTVLSFFMAVGPVVRLTRFPISKSDNVKGTGSHLVTFEFCDLMDDDSRVCRHGAIHPFPDIFCLFVGKSQPEITFSCNCVSYKLLQREEHGL